MLTKRSVLLTIAVIMMIVVLACGSSTPTAAPPPEEKPTEPPQNIPPAYVWIMEDKDQEYKAPHEDTLTLLNGNGEVQVTLSGFGTSETIGGHQALAVSPAGDFVIVTEIDQQRLSRVNNNGEIVWVLNRSIHAAGVSRSGLVYALTQTGLIPGVSLLVINSQDGSVLGEYPYSGFDIVVDDDRQSIWIVADDIERVGFDMVSQFTIDPIAWSASSVDLLPDGSVIVTEREHSGVPGSLNRLLRVSPNGEWTVLADLDYSPFDVAVNPDGGSFWVTAISAPEEEDGSVPLPRQNLMHYTQSGIPLTAIDLGGMAFSVSIDRRDGSVWVTTGDSDTAGSGVIHHLSSDGVELDRFPGYAGFTYLAVTGTIDSSQTSKPTEPSPAAPAGIYRYQSNFASGDTTGWIPISGEWVVDDGYYSHWDDTRAGAKTMFDDFHPDYVNCFTYRVNAKATPGKEGFLIIFPYQGRYVWWNIGGWTNTASKLEYVANDSETYREGPIQYNTWYSTQITVMGQTVAAWLNGEEQWRISRTEQEVSGLPDDGQRGTGLTGFVGLGTWETAAQFDEVSLIASCDILQGPIDVNTASIEVLATVPGLDWVKAQHLVDYRNRNGPFPTLENLIAVDVITPLEIRKMQPYVVVK